MSHLKGPQKEGQRDLNYYPTHADYVDGLDDAIAGATQNNESLATQAELSALQTRVAAAMEAAASAIRQAQAVAAEINNLVNRNELADYAKVATLENYAKVATLDNYAKVTDLDKKQDKLSTGTATVEGIVKVLTKFADSEEGVIRQDILKKYLYDTAFKMIGNGASALNLNELIPENLAPKFFDGVSMGESQAGTCYLMHVFLQFTTYATNLPAGYATSHAFLTTFRFSTPTYSGYYGQFLTNLRNGYENVYMRHGTGVDAWTPWYKLTDATVVS